MSATQTPKTKPSQITGADNKDPRAVTVYTAMRARMDMFAQLLPSHVPVERFMRGIMIACRKNERLLDCIENGSLIQAALEAATVGLDPSGSLGSAYIIPYKGVATFVPGYRGLIDLARRSGEIRSISANVVWSGDFFEYELGDNERLIHRPNLTRQIGDKDRPDFVYAIAHLVDGGVQRVVMSRRDVEKVEREVLSKITDQGKRQRSPWVTHPVEMWCKTAIRKLFKLLPVSTERLARALEQTERDFGDVVPPASLDNMLSMFEKGMAGDGAAPGEDVGDPPASDEQPPTERSAAFAAALDAQPDDALPAAGASVARSAGNGRSKAAEQQAARLRAQDDAERAAQTEQAAVEEEAEWAQQQADEARLEQQGALVKAMTEALNAAAKAKIVTPEEGQDRLDAFVLTLQTDGPEAANALINIMQDRITAHAALQRQDRQAQQRALDAQRAAEAELRERFKTTIGQGLDSGLLTEAAARDSLLQLENRLTGPVAPGQNRMAWAGDLLTRLDAWLAKQYDQRQEAQAAQAVPALSELALNEEAEELLGQLQQAGRLDEAEADLAWARLQAAPGEERLVLVDQLRALLAPRPAAGKVVALQATVEKDRRGDFLDRWAAVEPAARKLMRKASVDAEDKALRDALDAQDWGRAMEVVRRLETRVETLSNVGSTEPAPTPAPAAPAADPAPDPSGRVDETSPIPALAEAGEDDDAQEPVAVAWAAQNKELQRQFLDLRGRGTELFRLTPDQVTAFRTRLREAQAARDGAAGQAVLDEMRMVVEGPGQAAAAPRGRVPVPEGWSALAKDLDVQFIDLQTKAADKLPAEQVESFRALLTNAIGRYRGDEARAVIEELRSKVYPSAAAPARTRAKRTTAPADEQAPAPGSDAHRSACWNSFTSASTKLREANGAGTMNEDAAMGWSQRLAVGLQNKNLAELQAAADEIAQAVSPRAAASATPAAATLSPEARKVVATLQAAGQPLGAGDIQKQAEILRGDWDRVKVELRAAGAMEVAPGTAGTGTKYQLAAAGAQTPIEELLGAQHG